MGPGEVDVVCGGALPLRMFVDYLSGGHPKHVLARSGDFPMQIPDFIRRCVVFVAYRTESELKPLGTAFLVRKEIPGRIFGVTYAITAKHVVRQVKARATYDGKLVLRCNQRNGGYIAVDTEISAWEEHPSSTADVAAIQAEWDWRKLDHLVLNIDECLVTPQVIRGQNISLGDEIFFVGLFVKHSDTSRNFPIIRVGNIAAMPEEPIKTKDFGLIDGYLVEARSIGGMSGSPVIFYAPHRQIGEAALVQKMFYLLGLIHGHWDAADATEDFERDPQKKVSTWESPSSFHPTRSGKC
jgi:hypothetical protein